MLLTNQMPWRHMDFQALRKEVEDKKALHTQAQAVSGPSVYCDPPKYILAAVPLTMGRDSPVEFQHLFDVLTHV